MVNNTVVEFRYAFELVDKDVYRLDFVFEKYLFGLLDLF